ncbi:PREDICTED: AP-4 complex subunit epsilon-like isoform X2 [Ipomoea nil]|uniref:AP-4 complex subunit epsilon-like isoform X2 n=1 Tax=Ipomoea nil TaxID=35883 RepID=UPI0009019A54|nr:PREDICTED: AP-4 complex subunit epsilon-like isoform X2 [Ipomoea nil]
MEQLKTIGRELAMGSQGGFGQSKEFLDLIKSIGETRSKAEEDRIVLNEIETLKRRIVEPDIPKRKMKEYIIRLVYVEMLGHDASFGYIHAVKMTHDDSLLLKRTGYLAVTLFLNEDHDLIILIVNTIQKDLKSDNYLVVCAALNAVCKLINEETIPAVLPQVTELLGHPKEAVRKKAVMALHRFYQKSPSSVHHLISNFRKKLCDNDPGVMGATLCPLLDLITIDIEPYKDLVVSFVSILKQVAERRLPKSYDYHQTPAPFIQIKLLKILALLGCGDKKTSEHMYTIISEVMRKCDSTSNIGNAILYECICCVSSIHPSPKLLESAADAIAKFLKSDSHNLKYLGIDALGRLIKISPEIAEQHQLAVIDCLEDPDDTLKRKTFELLYKMTKSSNVEVIVDRMIDYMISLNDSHYKTEIASRCVELAEQFAPSNQWFIQTMNKVFEHAGDLVNVKVAHNLMRLIAEGFGEDDNSADSQLRSSAAYAISALTKIYSFEIAAGRKIDILPECQSFIEELLASHSTDLQQRAYELQAVIGLDARTLENIIPMDGSCEDIEVDKSLSFLNAYVQESLEKGAQPYLPESERSGMSSVANFRTQEQNGTYAHSLRFEAYELPKPSQPSRASPVSLSSSTELVPVPSYHEDVYETVVSKPSASDSGSSEVKLRLDGVQKKWGKPSYSAAPSTSDSSVVKTQSGATQRDVSSFSSKAPVVLNDSRKQQVEIDPEKQRFAASLFGGTSKSERKHSSATHKAHKPNSRTADKPHMEKSAPSDSGAVKTTPQPPPPDLLDLGEPTSSSAPPLDPFKQLESLLDVSHSSSAQGSDGVSSTKMADFMSLYGDTTSSGQSEGGVINPLSTGTGNTSLMFGFSDASDRNGHGGNTTPQLASPNSKGPNPRDAIEKDALVRQMGVTPSTQNPNLFSDLLG